MPNRKNLSTVARKIIDDLNRLEGLSASERQTVIVRFNEALHHLFPSSETLAEDPALASRLRIEMAVIEMIGSLDRLRELSYQEQVEALVELKQALGVIGQ